MIRVGAASQDKRVAAFALECGLDGFAFYHGIPGGIGGALRMNAGANGTETKDCVKEIVAIDRKGERHVLSNADMGYAYRHSDAAADLIFTEAVYQGTPAEKPLLSFTGKSKALGLGLRGGGFRSLWGRGVWAI